MKMQVKFVGESNPNFVKEAKYPARLIKADECKRILAIEVKNHYGERIRVDGSELQNFKLIP